MMSEHGRDQVAALYVAGLSTREVADRLGVEATTVRRWLREVGQPVRRPGPRGRTEVDTAALVAMRAAGLSWAKLATASGMSRTGVRRRVSPPRRVDARGGDTHNAHAPQRQTPPRDRGLLRAVLTWC